MIPRKSLTIAILLLLSIQCVAQNGYIKLENDSILVGYVRRYVAVNGNDYGYELWRTKTDKNPRRIPIRSIAEYAIKKDTFRVLQNFKPFHDDDRYFELLELKAISSGKLNLYILAGYNRNYGATVVGGAIPAAISLTMPDKKIRSNDNLWIIENRETGFVRGLPARHDELVEALRDFLPDRFIERYEQEKGPVNYKRKYIVEMLKLWNSH